MYNAREIIFSFSDNGSWIQMSAERKSANFLLIWPVLYGQVQQAKNKNLF